jgi:hypothetical protein
MTAPSVGSSARQRAERACREFITVVGLVWSPEDRPRPRRSVLALGPARGGNVASGLVDDRAVATVTLSVLTVPSGVSLLSEVVLTYLACPSRPRAAGRSTRRRAAVAG